MTVRTKLGVFRRLVKFLEEAVVDQRKLTSHLGASGLHEVGRLAALEAELARRTVQLAAFQDLDDDADIEFERSPV